MPDAFEVNVERFCVLKARVGGHRQQNCVQCKALKAYSVEFNHALIDRICDTISQAPEDAHLNPKKLIEMLQVLKIDPKELN